VYAEAWREGFDESHDDHYARRSDDMWQPDELSLQRTGELLDRLCRRIRGRRLLDVGCGRGEVVEAALRAGWQPMGIDLSRAAIEQCERRGLPCRVLDLFDPDLSGRRYDVIVISEFIEHVAHPRRYLERVRDLLDRDGRVYLTTPNFNSITHRVTRTTWGVIGEGHVAYYTPATLRSVLGTAGLVVESLTTRNVSLTAIRAALPTQRAVVPGSGHPPDAWAETQQLRHQIERSKMLTLAKRGTNRLLSCLGAGDTIVAVASV
jgi:2-polyprenyl-3-methyl-5-hydroxy-6-metoxy-1,4-benzoquinol methylase